MYCGKADNRLYTSSYCQSVITGRDRGTQWKIAMTGQCLHHPKIGAEACGISQWRLESDFELSWCARVAQRAKGSKKRGGQGQAFEGWSVGSVSRVSKNQAAAKNDRERQMTGFIADNNQAALNGTKEAPQGRAAATKHSSAGSVSGIINILRALSTAEGADELAVARKKVEG